MPDGDPGSLAVQIRSSVKEMLGLAVDGLLGKPQDVLAHFNTPSI